MFCMAAGPVGAQENDLFVAVPEADQDLSEAQVALLEGLRSDPTTKEVTLVQVDLAMTETADSINFNLLPDEKMEMSKTQVATRGAKGYTWYGEDAERQRSAILVVQDGDMVGTVHSGDQLYRIRSLGDGLHAVVEVDASKFPEDHPPEYEQLEEETPPADLLGPEADLADDCGFTDLIVAFTPGAKAQVGNIAALIQLAIDEANVSYDKSFVNPRVRLLHSYETPYVESGNMVTDRDRFVAPGDGHMDEIHGLRTEKGGDIAILITKSGGFCGIAAAILADTSTAFAVVGQNCATGYYSFGHEIGHLQGARHNKQADPTNTPFEWGHGFYYAPGHWRTIMSYNCPGGCTRQQRWSNPNVSIGGMAAGIEDEAYNVRVLNETACTMANFVPFPTPVTVTLIPAELKLRVGETKELTATVRQNGNPVGGVTVTFQSDDPGVATVPAAAVTGPSGQATVQVKGETDGLANVEAEAQGATDQAAVEVPFGSTWALALAAVLAVVLLWRRRARA
jgi:hypothetical protein